MFNYMFNLIKKYKAKNELNLIKLKLSYLFEEFSMGHSNRADVKYWEFYINRINELLEKGLIDSDSDIELYKSIYEKSIKEVF